MSDIDWKGQIKIDKSWHTNVLNHQFLAVQGKVTICMHSVAASGTQINSDQLVWKLAQLMPEFVLGQKKIQEISNPMDIAFHASKHFGDTDPDKDGKYGELLLFALVESQLHCKMVAHKIISLSSANDQVKGGDGIFLGNYRIDDTSTIPARLIGESKVVNDFNHGLSDAFESIYRFHDPQKSYLFKEMEWFVAANNVIECDINPDDIYRHINPQTEEFKKMTLVHPILIMYDSGEVRKCENSSKSKEELEQLLAERLPSMKDKMQASIKKQIEKYPEIEAIYLHFFMIPFNTVSAFRKAMYSRIHVGEYRPKSKK